MRRRQMLLVILLLGGVIAVVLPLYLMPAKTDVSLTTLAQLKRGMSEQEVATIFGPPTVDLTGVPAAAIPPPAQGAPFWVNPGSLGKGGVPSAKPGAKLLRYVGRRATVTAEFDEDGGLIHCYPLIHEISGLERIRLR